MISSLGGGYPQLRALLGNQTAPPSAYTGPRDDAIRAAFAAFDTPTYLSDALPGGSRERGVQVDTINEHLKCIFGLMHDTARVGLHAAHYIGGLDEAERSSPDALSVSRLTALAAFYIGLCQKRAFNAEGEFDTAGLIDFVAARLVMPKVLLEQELTGSSFGGFVFRSIQQSLRAPQLSILDAQGGDLCAPSPSLRFDGVPSGAVCNAYLRNVTISKQTLHALNLSAADLSGAYIDNTALEGVLFSKANLSNVVFRNLCATQCTFNGANLAQATFRDSRLGNVEFLNCTMTAVGFHATALQSTRFEQCDLRDMAFDNESPFDGGMRLSIDASEFRSCDMAGALLRHMQWSDGGIIDCCLWDTAISDSGFTRATLRHQVPILMRPPLSGATFNAIQFRACVMNQLNANESQWAHCLFEKGKLTEVSWRYSVLSALRFASVDMSSVRFDHAICQGLRIEAMCDLDRVSFANAKMTDVRFDAVQSRTMLRLNSADFSGAELDDVHFTKCQMVSAKFLSAQLRGVLFSRCNLNHGDFTRSVGGDLLRMLMANRMKRYRAEDMIVAGAAIGSLDSRARRDTLLNHISNTHCLLANVLTGMNGAMTAKLVLHLADRLYEEAHDPIDSDGWMIAALALSYKRARGVIGARARIDAHLFRMLQRHLPELNDLGLRQRPAHRWALDAADHLCRLLHRQREHPGVLWANSPLIAVMSVSVYAGDVTLEKPTRALLEAMRLDLVPLDLKRAFREVAGHDNLALPHAAMLTADGRQAVILLPATSAALLGVRPDPVAAECAYFAFKVIGDTWQFFHEADAHAAFAPFPLIAAALRPRAELLARLIDCFALPADLSETFKNGLINHGRHNLCGTSDQHRLALAFRPLITSMANAPGSLELAPWITVNLFPIEMHQARVHSALAYLYVDGDAAANGILAWGLASLLFRAASSEIFGLEGNSPQFLRYYAFAWVNQAIWLNPLLLQALGGVAVHLEIAHQAVGSSGDEFSCCAGQIGGRLSEAFAHPLLADHPHARRVRADLCG